MFKKLLNKLKRKPKFYLLDKQYSVVEAFTYKGRSYFCFDNSFKIPANRAMAALVYYEEMKMRCNEEYLRKHVKAMEILLSDPKKISINTIAVINNNLKERLNLAPFPDHIYKLASVIFFDDSESPYAYDMAYNKKKIEKWREDPEILSFFLSREIQNLMPSLNLPENSAQTYFQVAEEVDQMHQQDLSEVLSRLQ
jgi:hypothetical protein